MTVKPKSMLLMMVTVRSEDKARFNDWYDNEHIPELLRIPGVRSAQRLVDAHEPCNYLTLYELDDAEVVSSPAFVRWRDSSASSRQMLERMVKVTRGIFNEISQS